MPPASTCLGCRHGAYPGFEPKRVLSREPTLLGPAATRQPELSGRRWAFADPSEPPRQSAGGYGSFPCTDCIPDPNIGAKFIRDLYEKVDDTNGGS